MVSRRAVIGAMSIALLLLACGGLTAEPATKAAAQPAVVLDTAGVWRMYHTLRPPVVQQAAGMKPLLFGVKWLDWETPPPPADWTKPETDDRTWMHGPARRCARTPYLARLSMRGKFEVTEPARVRGLSLSLDYYGGAIVYLNGKELQRGHVAEGADANQALAEGYPKETYVVADGNWLLETPSWGMTGDPARVKLRTRSLNVAVPEGLVRKGLNVIGIDIVRAPYHQVVEEKLDKKAGYILCWNTCEIRRVQLTASGAEGLVTNATRPSGVQVWNADTLAGDVDMDYGDRMEPLAPIALGGARNSACTGKIIVGRSKPIRDLHVVATELRSGASTIPAAAVSFRYGIPGGHEMLPEASREDMPLRPYPQGCAFLNDLVAEAPKEYRVPTERKAERLAPGQPAPVLGAVAPVWVRVKVPKDAQPGTYTGTITVRMAEEAPAAVPVEVKVAAWTMPDPQDFRTWVELIESPDTLALEYDAPLWSDKHFALISKSFDLISDAGVRVVYIPVIAHTNHGNAESMVRWIKKEGGGYDWDFTPMEKYLDAAQKHLGTPKVVCLQVWEVYMSSKESAGRRFGEVLTQQQKASGGAPLVTILDPATGKTENATLPKLSDPASKPVWKSLLTQIRERLKKRGLEKTLILGMFTDSTPSKEDTKFFLDIAPDLAWVQQGHNLFKDLNAMAKVGYTTSWWSPRFADDSSHFRSDADRKARAMTSLFGWKNPRLDAFYERTGGLEAFPVTRWGFLCEAAVTSDIMHGIGRLGADFWRAVKNKEGRRSGFVHERFPDGEWKAVGHDISTWVLDPGADGPVGTNRLAALEQGVQECEARIFIETALTSDALKAKLGPALAKRCQETLDERLPYMWKCLAHLQLEIHGWGITQWRYSAGVAGHAWFLNSGWQERSERLYALAGEVAKALQGR